MQRVNAARLMGYRIFLARTRTDPAQMDYSFVLPCHQSAINSRQPARVSGAVIFAAPTHPDYATRT